MTGVQTCALPIYVIGVKANKKASEKARLKLALTSLTIDGTAYSIQTKLVTTKAQDNSKSATVITSGGAEASDESGLVFKFTAPVTVNRQRRGGSGGQALRAPARMAGCGENVWT